MVSDAQLSPLFVAEMMGLNPCFNGRWSRTRAHTDGTLAEVLILVLMEDGLGQQNQLSF